MSRQENQTIRLTTPTVRRGLVDALLALQKTEWPEPGYVLDSLETDDHVPHDHAFCYEHARIVQRGDQILTGCEMLLCDLSQSETNSVEYCAFYDCGALLDTGSPTDTWIDSALGLTEEDPQSAPVTRYELVRSVWNMTEDDPRWAIWETHARRVLDEARSKGKTRR